MEVKLPHLETRLQTCRKTLKLPVMLLPPLEKHLRTVEAHIPKLGDTATTS